MADDVHIKLSRQKGFTPKTSMLKFNELNWNIADGVLFGKGLDEDGNEVILEIGGNNLTAASHARGHRLDNESDHIPAILADYGKGVFASQVDGKLVFLEAYTKQQIDEAGFSKNFQPPTTHPDVTTVNVGDSWTDPVNLKEYRLVDQDGERWWVETTNF